VVSYPSAIVTESTDWITRQLALQFKFGELCDPWAEDDEFLSPEELAINPSEVVGFRGAIEKLKHLF
jgi:hypothetical protein